MGLSIIKNDNKELNVGEKKLLNKLKNLYVDYDKEVYLYVQPRICNMEPDFILIDSQRGISILEVKDWSIDYIKNINKRKAELTDRVDDNPAYKTTKYFNIVKGLVSTNYDIEDIDNNVYANLVLTNIYSKDISEPTIGRYLKQENINIITSEFINKITFESIFSKEIIKITEKNITKIRTVLFPEIKIYSLKNDIRDKKEMNIVKALDEEQENYARKLPYGHYMVTGVPGSGKTVILIARAIHLIKENPSWRVKIITYNNSLSSKITNTLNSMANYLKDSGFYNINIQNIDVSTFHKEALKVANTTVPRPTPKDWWDGVLPKIAIEKARGIYDAVLIDEYQDFRDDWIRLCIRLCKKYTYKNSNKEDVEGINLFIAGDRLQSIYNTKVHNWSRDFGINMSGRSKLLKTSYRAGKENAILALKFLQENDALVKEVNTFYKEDSEKTLDIDEKYHSTVDFIEGGYYEVLKKINTVLSTGSYKYKDILIVCKTWSDCDRVRELLPSDVAYNTRKVNEAKDLDSENYLLESTYHSSKGLEAKVVFLLDTDRFSCQIDKEKEILDRKLLYVGMTRASEKLFIHAKNFNIRSFAKDIKEISDNNK